MARGSQHDTDELIFETAGIPIGERGLDARTQADPSSPSVLLNARFLDERTAAPRYGHAGNTIQDGDAFGPIVSVSDEWVYGHGIRVGVGLGSSTPLQENAHHPIAGRGKGCFDYEGETVVWTGDRLLVARDGYNAIGADGFWDREAGTVKARGVPAYLPLQTDSTPPASVSAQYVETALTEKYRLHAANGPSSGLTVWIIDRATGALIDQSEISGASNDVVEPRLVNSGGTPVVLWRDFTDRKLYASYWTGLVWNTPTVLEAGNVAAYDVVPVQGGFHLVWRIGGAIFIGRIAGALHTQSTPYAFKTAVTLGGKTPSGAIAVGLTPNNCPGVVFEHSAGLRLQTYLQPDLSAGIGYDLSASTSYVQGLSVTPRGLMEFDGTYSWVVHASRGGTVVGSTEIYSITPFSQSSTTRFNSNLASKSFRVGDEVFCWLRNTISKTSYLVGGVRTPQVCGFADREVSTVKTAKDSNYGVPAVNPDPLDPYAFTWARTYNSGVPYVHGGDVRVGDMQFLPQLSTARFGLGTYLSGSAVRCWDGVRLGDAGFQSFPTVGSVTRQNTGFLTTTGTYRYRVYAVRYNARGERFQSAAVTSTPFTLAGAENQLTVAINTLPDTNHSDVMFEVYRTENGGTTYYFDGSVANSLTAQSVNFVSAQSDASLITQPGDSHAAGVNAISEIEEFGPLGCAILAVAGDRLWGAGGQVPPGQVQFSKLYEVGEGAGFDDLAGTQMVDTRGLAITAVHEHNDVVVVHQPEQLYVVAGTGPDNFGRGGFAPPQIVMADGAIHPFTGRTPLGTVYWGADGPRLLNYSYQVQNLSTPITPITRELVPSGVRVDFPNHEVVWYTEGGTALLWNYLNPRWSEWDGLRVAAACPSAVVTVDGVLLTEDPEASGDNGRAFDFAWRSGLLRSSGLIQGGTLLRAIGLVGKYLAPHSVTFRVFYDGAGLAADTIKWFPASSTGLVSGEDLASLNAAAIDALTFSDRSGVYRTHKRTSRQNCEAFVVEIRSSVTGRALVPQELSLEIGTKPGLGRVPVNTFTTKVSR